MYGGVAAPSSAFLPSVRGRSLPFGPDRGAIYKSELHSHASMVESQIRIVHISDTHITKFGMHIPEALDKCIYLINTLDPPPDIVVHSGDLTDNGILLDYEMAVEKIKEIRYEVLVAPGNHDERNYGDSLFREMVGNMDYVTSVGRTAFVILDSGIPDSDNGRLGRARQQRLRNAFENLPGKTFKVAVFHHHLIPIPYAGRERDILEDAGDVLKAILDLKVDLVLMGHRHVRHAVKVGETLLVNAGTVSSARTRGRLGNSFNIIDVTEDRQVTVSEMKIPSGELHILGTFRVGTQ
ncbi:3',5'-cyclic adenosine monophosphate phosphodiesterase CpdA [archaeon HR01]|nr:3',5'-cyclic adenosine monophosphate phosphodiesterase CpdA [archaeon HR01]